MRKFEHSGDTNKKFQKKLDKGDLGKNKDNKIKKSKNRIDGEDFGKKYDELFNKYAKEYPKYQDPSSVPFDVNSQDSIDLFQKNSQIKEQIIARVTAELKKGETAPVTKELEVSKNIDITSRTDAPDIVNQLNEEPIKKINPLSKKELETATIYDLQEKGYTTKDPEFDMVLKRGIAKTEARINRIANENNKEAENEKSQKINMLFEMGGPQAGEILNVDENGKTFKYTILENDGKNIIFTIDGGSEQKIGLRQIKEFLSKKGITFEFAGDPEEKVQDEKLAEVEEIGLTPEEEILYEQLQKEMNELEKDIKDLKKRKEEFLQKESNKLLSEINEINNITNIEKIIKDENIRKVFELVNFSLKYNDSVLTVEQEDLLGKHKNIVRQITVIQANKELAEKNLVGLMTEKSSSGIPIIKNQGVFKKELQIIKDLYYKQLSELK